MSHQINLKLCSAYTTNIFTSISSMHLQFEGN
ncbi:unnamed protein product [Brugia timori]|uniref:Uncharacterized protein n=1 Tax=Brugia timori TaxID=42155 RepID=A0A0R3RDA4_9BILA|nr:unnamed protein product [Brugia timori]